MDLIYLLLIEISIVSFNDTLLRILIMT